MKPGEIGEIVDVTSIRMSFFNMVFFMVKWFFASIVAVIIVGLIFTAVVTLVGAITGSGFDVQSTFNEFSTQLNMN